MRGNADEPDGIRFQTNGIPFTVTAATAPTGPPPTPGHTWQHPTGERIQTWAIAFTNPNAA
jgi:hypothetical protein